MSEPFPNDVPDGSEDIDGDHMVETPESLRDADPEAPPMDRGIEATDRPLGAEKFGTTHFEAAEGESLDYRLSQERPDVGEHDPVDDIVAADPATFATGSDAEQTDDEVLGDAYGDTGSQQDGFADLNGSVGRLVEPDEGAHTDVEKDMVATDVGPDGGDLSAEEAALHLEEER